jgi:transcription-repair coupling factor (superfamily II helicase)
MLDLIRKHPRYVQVLDDIKVGKCNYGLGLSRPARLAILSALSLDLNVPILVITDRADRSALMMDEMGFWLPEHPRLLFPEPTPMFYEKAVWGAATRQDRLTALNALVEYQIPGRPKPENSPILFASLRAVMTKTLPRREFILASKAVKAGQQIPPGELRKKWVELGYEASDVVLDRGQFSQRGGILDIWPMAERFPVRLDFFGDEVESIRQFDPTTQRTIARVEQVTITPSREFLTPPAQATDAAEEKPDEFFIPLYHAQAATILDYLPKNALIVLDNLANIQVFGEEIEEQALKMRRESIEDDTIPDDFPIPYVTWSEILDTVETKRFLELGRSNEPEDAALGSLFQPEKRFGGQLAQFIEFVHQTCEHRERMTIVSRQISRLKEIWRENGGAACAEEPIFIEGSLTEGWCLALDDATQAHLISDSEVFGWERPHLRSRARASFQAPESTYADLTAGDWVVHVDHGIGRFVGLVKRTLEGIEREFLLVEYENHDQLFVPIPQADRISKYIGPYGEPPRSSRLGSTEWAQTKQNVRQEVVKVAQDLLDLYARRYAAQGFSFSADQPWQKELEASFPYIETDDQLKAIREVKKDMETPRPMDRLLCGDVGYGKTEVALRAAFKAVMDDKQVAVLVPTTVLAQQHFDTFRQRLSAFPVTVEMLSRFRTPREQDEIILKLALGEVDIVIGTHRLLTQDVVFKDLGLVVIDEEQRFGVTHKEHFKKLRTELDVLTLTATPIPRTLYMALTGARDISIINTPPAERLPIVTHIGPYSPRLVTQAITREMERGGQVFFVHNRVQTIEAMQSHLHALVPEARIAIAHGQMQEQELSGVMTRFTHGEVDVLLCTSIIESGLDIPNANTLIVDRGDTFGLAQLYQLRGRVGRGTHRAYAYFFRHRKKAPTVEGQERLETIAENTQLGAGYSIAMRDLEMRGAGEMLGTRQSGFIASIGFHLYTRMLSQAVRELRKVKPDASALEKVFEFTREHNPVSVDLPLSVNIPMDYVADQSLRLQLYRRIAAISTEEDLAQLREEFKDRFGHTVEPVENLFYQLRVRMLGEQAGLSSISNEGDQIVLRFPTPTEGVPALELPPLGFQTRPGKNAYWMRFDARADEWRERLVRVLEEIIKK